MSPEKQLHIFVAHLDSHIMNDEVSQHLPRDSLHISLHTGVILRKQHVKQNVQVFELCLCKLGDYFDDHFLLDLVGVEDFI